jgi:large conductance mechanosensitive channel
MATLAEQYLAGEAAMLSEFKQFALRGNVVDLAIAVVIGAAFGLIVTSLVADIIMPIIGAIFGGLDFSNYYLPLSSTVDSSLAYADAKKQGAVLGYGQFLTVAVNFAIIAFVLFMIIRAINRLKRKQDARTDVSEAPEIAAEIKLLSEIRDLLAGHGSSAPLRP